MFKRGWGTVSSTLFLVNMVKDKHTLQSIKLHSILLFCLLVFSPASYAIYSHPSWLQESLDKADKLNDKDPSLALEFAQKLLNKHNEQLSPSGKAALFSRLARYQYYLAADTKSLEYINQYYELSADLTNKDGISVLITHGSLLDAIGKTKQAMELFHQATENAKAINSKEQLGEVYGAIAWSYTASHNDSEALKYFNQAYLTFEESGNELQLAYLKVQMAYLYSYIFDEEKAILLGNEAIEYFKQHEYYFDELTAQNSLAQTYMRTNEYDKAIQVHQRVIELSHKVEDPSLVHLAYFGLAGAYLKKKENEKARHYFNLYKEVSNKPKDPFLHIATLMFSAELDFADKNITLAQEKIKEVVMILSTMDKTIVLSWQMRVLTLKANIAEFNDDYKSAYQLEKEILVFYKSIQSNEREQFRSKYKVMFDTDQALLKNQILESEKELLEHDNQHSKAALESVEQQHKLQTSLTITISLLAIGLLFFTYNQRKNSAVLYKLANTDALTELANRRYTFIYAENMLLQAKKNKENFAVIIFDIDHFKKINDTYGHAGGDVALKCIAAIANEYVRNNDILGRIGGEEFLVVLPNTSVKQAFDVAERIRKAIVDKDIILDGKVVHISASFGISQLAQNQPNFNQIFHEADIALYQAKNSGRNCISLAS